MDSTNISDALIYNLKGAYFEKMSSSGANTVDKKKYAFVCVGMPHLLLSKGVCSHEELKINIHLTAL